MEPYTTTERVDLEREIEFREGWKKLPGGTTLCINGVTFVKMQNTPLHNTGHYSILNITTGEIHRITEFFKPTGGFYPVEKVLSR